MSEESGWKEVYRKFSSEKAPYLFVKVLFNEEQNVALIVGTSYSTAVWWAEEPFDRAVRPVKNYVEAIEWGQEIAFQWFTKYKLQQSKE